MTTAMLREVAAGLALPQKELSPKYFYDTRGSELFEEITRLPEYYLTRAERALLTARVPELIASLRPATLVELGAGNADKTRIILDAMHAVRARPVYVPIDVSAEFLDDTAGRLRAEYPALEVVPVIGDITENVALPDSLPGPILFAFLGSTIGNFEPDAAVALLQRVRAAMRPGDAFLLGADLRKDVARIEAAYNDSRGVTAEFNRNVLRVMNRELGADFDLSAFEHLAFYEPLAHRIEMHLVSQRAQQVHIPGLAPIDFAAGETIRTEISTKYDRATIERILDCAQLRVGQWITDADGTFSLSVARREMRDARYEMPDRLTRPVLVRDVRERFFRPSAATLASRTSHPASATPRIGAEIEMLPVDRLTRRPRTLDGGPGSVLEIVRDAGAARGWVETVSKKAGVPEFHLADGSRITFEPGGQIEYSSPAFPSASRLLDVVRRVVGALEASAERSGAEMLFVGIDPLTAVQDVAPQLDAPRYTRMRRYFASIGPSGARMMRQTASFQVSVDAGEDPIRSWRFLNALAPYLVAVFANSPIYEGRSTGHQSIRREVWATLDPLRTGLPGAGDGDPTEYYVDFALDAPAFLLGDEDAPVRPFRDWLADDPSVTLDDWHTHLSTLFPEVRPRGYFELRSADAVAPEWHAAPLALVAGLMYDPTAFAAAEALLGAPDRSLLDRVGRDGLRDAQVGAIARQLWVIAADGCRRLGPAFLGPADFGAAEAFFTRYTLAGRSPADDPRDAYGVPERARRRLARFETPPRLPPAMS